MHLSNVFLKCILGQVQQLQFQMFMHRFVNLSITVIARRQRKTKPRRTWISYNKRINYFLQKECWEVLGFSKSLCFIFFFTTCRNIENINACPEAIFKLAFQHSVLHPMGQTCNVVIFSSSFHHKVVLTLFFRYATHKPKISLNIDKLICYRQISGPSPTASISSLPLILDKKQILLPTRAHVF